MTAQPLILASASPRRRHFMELLGLPFEAHIADIDERNGQGEPPNVLVARLGREKALALAAVHPQAVIIGADTIVTLDGELLGKPGDPAEAIAMLRRLRDRPHQVYSGICVRRPNGGQVLTAVVESKVWMRDYTDAEIEAYIASGSPFDKAGAYGIQDACFHPVARLRGCYASVMGLPLCQLAGLLDEVLPQIGLALPKDVPTVCSTATGVPCCGGETVELVPGV